VYETPTAPRPIGTSIRNQPIALLGLNCGSCHTGTLRDTPDGRARIVLGMPAQQLDAQAYLRFLFAVGDDPRFNPDVLLPAIHADNANFSWANDLLYRYIVIPRTRDALRQRTQSFAWMDRRPPFLPGRVDTFNPYKGLLGIATDDTVGTSDLPSLWNQRPREGLQLHWDGNNDSLDERNRSATLGAGATPDSLDDGSLQRVKAWILDLPAPPFPIGRINPERAAVGQRIYEDQCAACHALDGAQVGKVTPLAEIGTDPGRLNSFTPQLAQAMNTLGQGHPWKFSHFRKTDGYANMPLDGLWLRAPYLHNGSVPTLRDLLKPPDQRPKVFFRGYDVYDYDNVGFVSSGADAERVGARYDTSMTGNGNGGHVYGTRLTDEEHDALLEYLKTL
jgi:hypothetical protein